MANDISDFLVGVLVHSVDVQDVDSAGQRVAWMGYMP